MNASKEAKDVNQALRETENAKKELEDDKKILESQVQDSKKTIVKNEADIKVQRNKQTHCPRNKNQLPQKCVWHLVH